MEIILFPSLGIVAIFLGFIYEGIDRKITARMHNRIGPPVVQPIYDFFKLLMKENITPEQVIHFSFFPILAVASALTTAYLVFNFISFQGDVVLLIFLLILTTMAIALSGFSSAGAFSVVGGIREIILLIGYEVPLAIAIILASLSSGSFSLHDVYAGHSFLPFAFLGFLLCTQAKLTRSPFHIADADTEIVAGVYTEFSGVRYALLRLTHAIELFIMVSLAVMLFLNSRGLSFILYSAIVLFFLIVLKVVTARFRIEQSFKFFWGIITPLVLIDFLRIWIL